MKVKTLPSKHKVTLDQLAASGWRLTTDSNTEPAMWTNAPNNTRMCCECYEWRRLDFFTKGVHESVCRVCIRKRAKQRYVRKEEGADMAEITDPDEFIMRVETQEEKRKKYRKTYVRTKASNAQREKLIVEVIMQKLRDLGGDPVKNHGSVYGKRGRPDIEVLLKIPPLPFGVFFGIEVKRSERIRPTSAQERMLDSINAQGGVGFVAWSWEVVEARIDGVRAKALEWSIAAE